MEIVAQTNYQDVYRITDGVLLIVNKFIPIDYSDKTSEYVSVFTSEAKVKSYNKNCQSWLKVLKEDYDYKYCPIVIPKGTVLYMSTPVICTENKHRWRYELKTTGTSFSGNHDDFSDMLGDIIQILDENEP